MMPVLWSRIPESEWDNHESYNPPHEMGNYNCQDVHQPDDCSWHPGQTVIVPQEEQKKKWHDLDDDRREQLKIGGGLLAGTATIDAGYHAWDKKKREGELKRKNKLSRGICRDGSVMLMCAQRSSATTVLVLPRPGFSSTDVTIFQTQP